MARRTAAPARTNRRHGAHAAAGFVIGLLAVSTIFLFGGQRVETGPVSEARQHADVAAAVRLSFDPDARPVPARTIATEPVPFAEDGAPLITNRHATRVVISSVGIDADVRPVGYAFSDGRLRYDVPRAEAGQYVGTGQPGRPGNTVIGGHVAQRGGSGIFAALPRVAAGDVVEVYRDATVYRYLVTEIRIVAADATSVMSPTQDATLTLITCFPDDNYSERLVVVGKLIEQV
jgi:LPXTG-site transpeptidase (sortase) family protein